MEETTAIFIKSLTPPSSLSSTLDHANYYSFHSRPLPTLPFDILPEILCRLPVKLLLQLRCLCKFFNTLISDSKFSKKHLRMSTKRHHLILTSNDESDEMSYPLHSFFNSVTINATQIHFPFKKQYHGFVSSCDGILCLNFDLYSIFLWNPSIQKFTKLPCLKNPINATCIKYGFGYDPLIDNYKVVAVFHNSDGYYGTNKDKIKVHTLGTNSWRLIEGNFPVPMEQDLKFVSSTLNWIVCSNHVYNVVSFKLVNGSHRKFLPPNFGGEDMNYVTLGVLRDSLCISACSCEFYSVWLMKEYGNEESWIKLFCVPYLEDPSYYPYIKPIWISEDDQVLMECTSLLKPKKYYFVYGFKDGTFIPKTPLINGWITPQVYHESLVSPCF